MSRFVVKRNRHQEINTVWQHKEWVSAVLHEIRMKTHHFANMHALHDCSYTVHIDIMRYDEEVFIMCVVMLLLAS